MERTPEDRKGWEMERTCPKKKRPGPSREEVVLKKKKMLTAMGKKRNRTGSRKIRRGKEWKRKKHKERTPKRGALPKKYLVFKRSQVPETTGGGKKSL